MSDSTKYRILGLSKLDVKLIQSRGGQEISFVEAPEMDAQRHNELATLALVGSFALIGQAAAYFFGKSEKEEITISVEEIAPDGSRRAVVVKLNRSKSEPVENQILKALAAVGN